MSSPGRIVLRQSARQFMHGGYDFREPMRAARAALAPDEFALAWCASWELRDLLPRCGNLDSWILRRVGGAIHLQHEAHLPPRRMDRDAQVELEDGMDWVRYYLKAEGAAAIFIRKHSIVSIHEEPREALVLVDDGIPGHDHLEEIETILSDHPDLFEL